MKLPPPPQTWAPHFGREVNRQIEQSDRQNLKRGRDVEMGDGRVILTAPDGGRWALQVANDGTLSAVGV